MNLTNAWIPFVQLVLNGLILEILTILVLSSPWNPSNLSVCALHAVLMMLMKTAGAVPACSYDADHGQIQR